MLGRFHGERGPALVIEALSTAKLLIGEPLAVEKMAAVGELLGIEAGATFIEQLAATNDVFFIISGTCSVVINGRQVAKRGPGDTVGEMAAIQPSQPRSASVAAVEPCVLLKVTEAAFTAIANEHPRIYRRIAQVLATRLAARNSMIGSYRDRTRVFIISSVESLPIARILETSFQYDDFSVHLWTAGCFRAANYTLDDLERAVDESDFAVAIAHADDVSVTIGRGDEPWPAPRDNVIFELGLFMGRLGRQRAILMEPRGRDVKLPSDLAGVTTIPYRFEKGGENHRLMGPACNQLRDHILLLGPNNG